jgi:hypothetical protein
LTREDEESVAIWFPETGETPMALSAYAMEGENKPQIQQPSHKAKEKLNDLLSPSPKRIKSDIDDCVRIAKLVKVGQRIAGEWEKVARQLGPQPLSRDSILAIKKREQDPEEQAHMMLDKWYKKHGEGATCQHLIKALIESEKRAVAESVFGDLLVKAVVQKLKSSDEGKVAVCPCADDPPPQEILNIISRKGCEVWRQFGRGLGYDDSKLTDIVSDNPTCVNSEKLHKVLSHWQMNNGSDATLRRLIEVCQSDDVAIYGAVDIEICHLYGVSISL